MQSIGTLATTAAHALDAAHAAGTISPVRADALTRALAGLASHLDLGIITRDEYTLSVEGIVAGLPA